ncbi:hypothetical protein LSH36_148g05047 [Paralvinella palmiformis]|uniref:Uncharacterized protein n=1 Tax=Paralvinella palmiformis TaxID=53620 RepID=A0AAD9NA43_9ANNE|nr:hypothetical protein LSH36_148g05047 [Paralvinella palmiformis]
MSSSQRIADILINGDQFFDASRPEITSADVDSMPLSAALGELFSPFGILEVEESTECATIDVVTDLLHMSNDISSYNEPSLPESAARSLLDYLTERYSMPEPILQIASLDMAPSDTHKLRRQCARALSDEPVSSLELTGLLQQYHDAMTLAGDKPAPSYIASFIAQHRNKLGKTGITDISPIQILTAFCQILLDESEKNGLSRVKLTKAIRQSLDRLENDGVQPGSGDVADSNAIGYTVDVLSGLLDVMRKIVDDIAGVLIQTNVTDGFQKRPF